MLNNLLALNAEGNELFWGAFVFILGMLVVFLGIAIIIVAIKIVEKVISLTSKAKKNKAAQKEEASVAAQQAPTQEAASGEIPAEVKAAIVAAISAYYMNTPNSNCEFRVRKIKRI